jgi:hypothetical protein
MTRLLIVLLVVLGSCEPDEKSVPEIIVGSWKWERTDGGLGNHIHDTPETTGNNVVWIFTSGDSYRKTNNGVEIESGTYRVRESRSTDEGARYSIWFSSSDITLFVLEQKDDSLFLSDGFADGVTLQFSRLNPPQAGE